MKILLFANTDWYLYNFRLPLAQALHQRGDEVVLLSPAGPYADRLEQAGLRWERFALARRGVNPLYEAASLARLTRLYRRQRPDLVHHFTIKCVLYGSLAARLTGVPRVVNAITGLGFVFGEHGQRGRLLQGVAGLLYRFALRGTQVIFQNRDDLELFCQRGWVKPEQTALIGGSGIDLARFHPEPEPDGPPVVILPARLLWDKGVGEFVAAARLLKAGGSPARFVLVGTSDPGNPKAVPAAQLQVWQQEGLVEWWGWQEDMPAVLRQAHLVCLPSYYREGAPRALLEAAASGRACVTVDGPGCREVVQHGQTGLLVAGRDVPALATALQTLIAQPEMRRAMGARGRALVEEKFGLEKIVTETLGVYTR